MGQNEEIFKHIELFVGSIGVILSLFFGLFLLISRRQQPKANIFLAVYLLAFSLRIGKSLFFNYFPIDPVIRNIFLGVLLAIGPSLWLYASLLRNGKPASLGKTYVWHYIPMLLFMCFCWWIPNDGSAIAMGWYFFLLIHIATYTSYTILYLLYTPIPATDRASDIQKWLLFFCITTLIVALFIGLLAAGIIPYYMGMAFLFSIVIICFAVWALKNPFLFRLTAEKYANSSLDQKESKGHMQRIALLMKEDQLFLNPELSLAMLSENIGISSKKLSQVINQAEGVNYSQYITGLRVSEAQRRLRSEEFKHYKIAAIAYDSGFNSISSFNTAFKKITKQTAVAYRQSKDT